MKAMTKERTEDEIAHTQKMLDIWIKELPFFGLSSPQQLQNLSDQLHRMSRNVHVLQQLIHWNNNWNLMMPVVEEEEEDE